MQRATRRQFLYVSAAAGLGLSVSAQSAPSERVRVACIGVRGQGGSLLHTFAGQPDVEITHICDIDESVRIRRGKEIEQKTGRMPLLLNDYREMLDDKSVDAITVGTPDHWHAIPTIHACQAGKDVYVEKPDGHNIHEGRTMVAAARKYDRMVQMGTQARSAPDLMEAAKFVQGGGIGKVIFGRAWETTKQGSIGKPADGEVPSGVDYDRWLGPAPKRPFNVRRFHGSWRWFFDYGTGDLGNDGVHRLDFCRWVMGVKGMPTAVSCSGGKYFFDDAQEWPDTQMVTYEYPGQLLVYEMRVWSRPRLLGEPEGAAVYGDAGWVLISNSGWKAYDGDGKVLRSMDGRSPLGLHVRNFLDAVRSRRRGDLNQEIAQGHESSVLCHAGNIAWRVGKKLRFDPATETFSDADADRLVRREYRKGYELPSIPGAAHSRPSGS